MNNNTFSRWKESLHLKILSGYLILGLLVLGIITAVWYEKQVFEQAEAEERSLLMQRAAASEAYRGLITLFLDNDRAMLWDDSDMETYDRRESHTMEVIDRLKGYYGEPAQTARIDTVVRLLHEKRRLIERMVDMPTTAYRMDSLLERHLPGLEQTASVRTTTVTERTEPEEEKKRGGLFGLFRKKKKEEPARTTTRVSTTPNTRHIAEMRRFEEEMRTGRAGTGILPSVGFTENTQQHTEPEPFAADTGNRTGRDGTHGRKAHAGGGTERNGIRTDMRHIGGRCPVCGAAVCGSP